MVKIVDIEVELESEKPLGGRKGSTLTLQSKIVARCRIPADHSRGIVTEIAIKKKPLNVYHARTEVKPVP